MSSNPSQVAFPAEDLEALLSTAVAEATARREEGKRASRRPKPPGQAALDSTYKDPANWVTAANVLLTHEQITPDGRKVQTDLGMFLEKIHRTEPGAKWLIRTTVQDHSLPTRSEIIRGSWPKVHYDPTDRPSSERQFLFRAIIHAELDVLDLECQTCDLDVKAVWGLGILEARTAERSRFVSQDGGSVMWLPKGMDVYSSLSHASKLDLKAVFDAESEEQGREDEGE